MPTSQLESTPVTSPLPSPSPLPPKEETDTPIFPVVAVGGTFDHLHAGHKILLSMTAWICKEKIIVGVTGMLFHPDTGLDYNF